jgi:putative component of membrane protein insertase Oxa1/YidC/SpoIIIJ protein YidD
MTMLSSLLQSMALTAIRAYQRWLSPHKGFACAFRVHTGRDSCSAYGYRVIKRYGLPAGLALLRRRLAGCGVQHRLHAPPCRPQAGLRHQAGFCDVPCDLPCDAPCGGGGKGAGRLLGSACDVASCGCDLADVWRDWKQRRKERRGRRSAEHRPEE